MAQMEWLMVQNLPGWKFTQADSAQFEERNKEPNKTRLWRSSIGLNCSLWHFLGCGGFDLCRVWSIDNHKIREARKVLSQAGEFLKNMFQEWQMVKIGGIASKLWHPMMWKMDTGSQNDENFINFLPKFESSSSLFSLVWPITLLSMNLVVV
jgi:hypothetical protein